MKRGIIILVISLAVISVIAIVGAELKFGWIKRLPNKEQLLMAEKFIFENILMRMVELMGNLGRTIIEYTLEFSNLCVKFWVGTSQMFQNAMRNWLREYVCDAPPPPPQDFR